MAGQTAREAVHVTADSNEQHSAWRMDAEWGELREREKA